MNNITFSLWSLPSFAAICWSGYLASLDKSAWIWFMAAGLFTLVLPIGTMNMMIQSNKK